MKLEFDPSFSISDINECSENTDNCHVNAQCANTIGSFQCECLPGFAGNGVTSCIPDSKTLV